MLDTPVLFIVFNRPGPTSRVFAAIRDAKPRQLFIAADGPRTDRAGEAARCEEVRQIVREVDWDCTVHTLFRAENLGCGRNVSEAISWFFDQVEEGIVLEDDCLPSASFFPFCAALLERYRHDPEVSIISGFNIDTRNTYDDSYFFTPYAGIWGWASWRRAWSEYRFQVPEVLDPGQMMPLLATLPPQVAAHLQHSLEQIATGSLDTWDYQWWFARVKSRSLGIVPSVNLIANIGFGVDATHTTQTGTSVERMRTGKLQFPLTHTPKLIQKKYSEVYEQLVFGLENKTFAWWVKRIAAASWNKLKTVSR